MTKVIASIIAGVLVVSFIVVELCFKFVRNLFKRKGECMKIQILQGKTGAWYWRLVAKNNKILAHSESYDSKRNAKKTAKKVASNMLICTLQTMDGKK